MPEITIWLPIALAVVSLTTIVGLLVTSRKPVVEQRVKHLSHHSRSRTGRSTRESRSSLAAVASDREEKETLADRIIQAGFYKKGTIAGYYVTRVIFMVAPLAIGLAAYRVGKLPLSWGLFWGLIAGAMGTVLPSLWLDYLKHARQTKIRRALPDALDVVIVCVEAGLSLPAALKRVSKELRTAHPMLSAELAICQREIQMGCTTGESLRRLSQRFDLEELRSLASVIQQAERFGASIVSALRVHADTLRLKRFQRAEELAQQAVVKLVFPTILCIFPALFVVLAGPAVFRIFEMFDKMAS